jgi:hypothetical protein
VHRPGVDEVGALRSGEVPAVVVVCVVPVTRTDDEVVLVRVAGEERGDALRDGGAAGHRERALLGEVVLDVDDEQCPGHAAIQHPAAQDPVSLLPHE